MMPGKFVSTTGTEGSGAISRSIGVTGNTRSEEDQQGSIQRYKRSAMQWNGSSAGLRHSRRLFRDMSGMSTHSWDWFSWHAS